MRRTPSHFAGFEDGERGHDSGNVEVSRSWNRNIEEDFFLELPGGTSHLTACF